VFDNDRENKDTRRDLLKKVLDCYINMGKEVDKIDKLS
jgi:hypothetical protein